MNQKADFLQNESIRIADWNALLRTSYRKIFVNCYREFHGISRSAHPYRGQNNQTAMTSWPTGIGRKLSVAFTWEVYITILVCINC